MTPDLLGLFGIDKLLAYFVCWVMTGIILAANFLIEGLALILAGFLALLPPMPELPAVPDYVVSAFAFGRYFFPIDFILTLLTLYFLLWAAYKIISIPLRWAKAD